MRVLLPTIVLTLVLTTPLGLSAQEARAPIAAPSNGRVAPSASPAFDPAPSLSPPKTRSAGDRSDLAKTPDGGQSFTTVVISLAVVLGIFFCAVWVLRRASPGALATLPVEAFEVLGRAALANRHQVHLLRCGNKLLLVSVTVTGAATLSEITDPAEVERLSELCRQTRANVAATTLRRVFRPAEARNV
jgi:flagellar protein FliO/FliZ